VWQSRAISVSSAGTSGPMMNCCRSITDIERRKDCVFGRLVLGGQVEQWNPHGTLRSLNSRKLLQPRNLPNSEGWINVAGGSGKLRRFPYWLGLWLVGAGPCPARSSFADHGCGHWRRPARFSGVFMLSRGLAVSTTRSATLPGPPFPASRSSRNSGRLERRRPQHVEGPHSALHHEPKLFMEPEPGGLFRSGASVPGRIPDPA
jgi:hypothetical protein